MRFLFVMLLSSYCFFASAQQSAVRLLGGFGSQDYFHYGINLQLTKWNSIEFTKGRFFYDPDDTDSDNSVFFKTLSISSYIFLDRSEKYKGVPTWFTKQNYTFWTDLETLTEERYKFVGLQFGRYLNVSRGVSMSISAGAMKIIKRPKESPVSSNSTLRRRYSQDNLGIHPLVQVQFGIKMVKF